MPGKSYSHEDIGPDHPGWLEVSIRADPVAHEALSAFLFDLGSEGLVTEETGRPCLKAYLSVHQDLEKIRQRILAFFRELKDIFPEMENPELSLGRVAEQDWNLLWRRFFRTERVSGDLLIVPAWESVPEHAGGHVIRLDPGPAFGTGQHPTTRMCLEAMEKVPRPETWTMLDVGTGSGVLAIYGAKLGARRVLALDIDPEALRWAERNVRLNGPLSGIQLSSMPLEACQDRFSLLTANLTSDLISELFPHFIRVLEPRGWLILSGVLREQVDALKARLSEGAFSEQRFLRQAEWACVSARKIG